MTRQTTSCALPHFVVLCVLCVSPSVLCAQGFLDDFSDGSISDGEPVSWLPFSDDLGYGTTEVVDGNLHLTPLETAPPITLPGISPDYIELDVYADDRVFQDVIAHASGRVSGSGQGWLAIMVRDTWNLDDNPSTSVWGQIGIDHNGTQWLDLGGHTGTDFMSPVRRTTPLNFHDNDIHLQLEVIGKTARLFAWADGEEKPVNSLLTRTLAASQVKAGNVALSYGQSRPPATPLNTAQIRFIEVVPEPTSFTLILLALFGIVPICRNRNRHC